MAFQNGLFLGLKNSSWFLCFLSGAINELRVFLSFMAVCSGFREAAFVSSMLQALNVNPRQAAG